jgi:hypothetical protein
MDRDATMEAKAELIQQLQTTLGRLQMQYSETAVEFWALRLAWETVRLAWYVVAQHHDGGKLALVEGALKDRHERYSKEVQLDEEAR